MIEAEGAQGAKVEDEEDEEVDRLSDQNPGELHSNEDRLQDRDDADADSGDGGEKEFNLEDIIRKAAELEEGVKDADAFKLDDDDEEDQDEQEPV